MTARMFAFCVLLVMVMACVPVQNASVLPAATVTQVATPAPSATATATATTTATATATWTSTPSATATATLTHTPTQTATATSTPTLTPAPRTFDLPWGRVNLDLPIEETNQYAMALWCEWRWIHLRAEDLPKWFTNPVAMIHARGYHRYVINVEITEVSSVWQSKTVLIRGPHGEESTIPLQYFEARGIIRRTPDKSDTQRIKLWIASGTPIATNMPSDKRLYNGPGNSNTNYIAPVEAFTVTGPSQIRIGQIYGIAYYDSFLWPKPIDQLGGLSLYSKGNGLLIYTVMPEWEWSCAYKQQMGWIK